MTFPFLCEQDRILVLNAPFSADCTGNKHSRSSSGKTKYFTAYSEIVILLLKRYAIEMVIAETGSDNTRFAHPSQMTPSQYAEQLVTKTLRCGDV